MKATLELENKYWAEVEKIEDRCKELEDKNKTDLLQIESLTKQYNEAIIEMDDEKADKLYEDIFQLKKDINNRANKLAVLKNKNPETNSPLRKAANELLDGYIEQKENLKKRAEKAVQEVQKAREAYLKTLATLIPINQEGESILYGINDIYKQTDKELQEKYNLHPKIGAGTIPPVLCRIGDFEVKSNDVHEFHKQGGVSQ